MGEKTPKVNQTKEDKLKNRLCAVNMHDEEKNKMEVEVSKEFPSNLIVLPGIELEAETFYINEKGERIDETTGNVLSGPTEKTIHLLEKENLKIVKIDTKAKKARKTKKDSEDRSIG